MTAKLCQHPNLCRHSERQNNVIYYANCISQFLKTIQIKVFGKLIIYIKIAPLYETNNFNIFLYFTRMLTIFYSATEISTKQFSFVLSVGIVVPSKFVNFLFFIKKTTQLMIRYNDPPVNFRWGFDQLNRTEIFLIFCKKFISLFFR